MFFKTKSSVDICYWFRFERFSRDENLQQLLPTFSGSQKAFFITIYCKIIDKQNRIIFNLIWLGAKRIEARERDREGERERES